MKLISSILEKHKFLFKHYMFIILISIDSSRNAFVSLFLLLPPLYLPKAGITEGVKGIKQRGETQ